MIKQKRHFENLIGGRLIYFMPPEQAYKHYGRWVMKTKGIPFIAEVEEYMEKTVFSKREHETKKILYVALRDIKTHRFLEYQNVNVNDPNLFDNYASLSRVVDLRENEKALNSLKIINSIDESIEEICNQLKSYSLKNRPDACLPTCSLSEVAKKLKQVTRNMYEISWMSGHDRLANALSKAFNEENDL